jgi:hypothetical protein
MARPHIDDKEKRIVQVNIRLTLDENDKVNHYASASGLSPANWIRKKVFSGKFPAVKQSPLDTAIYQELRKIGVNLNQAVHKINKGELPAFFFKHLLELQAKIKEIIKILIDDRESG